LLAGGKSTDQALREIGQVVEGYLAARALHHVAAREKVEMPICEGIYRMLYEGMPAREVVKALMSRPIKAEFSESNPNS
jgi:glycerol-3-phosphate dehydrogenase (NAD(P)+)